jgi:hypothetical protein
MSDEYDVSTHRVINWLLHLKIPYFRLNDTCSIHIDYLTTANGELDFKLTITGPYLTTPFSICANDIKGYWYRRGSFELEKIKIQEVNATELSMVKGVKIG